MFSYSQIQSCWDKEGASLELLRTGGGKKSKVHKKVIPIINDDREGLF